MTLRQPHPEKNQDLEHELEKQLIAQQINLQGLRGTPIYALIIASMGLGLLVALYGQHAITIGNQPEAWVYVTAGVVLMAVNRGALWLYRAKQFERSAMVTLVSFIIVSNLALLLPNGWQSFAPYISVLIVVVSGLLIMPEMPFWVALISVLTNIATLVAVEGLQWDILTAFYIPIAFAFIAATTVWASTGTLLSAFNWAVQSQDKVRQRGDELFETQQLIKKANKQLEAQAIELRQAQAATAAALIVAEEERAKADSANQAKSDFLSAMSHELRTPLNGILGYAQILRRRPELDADMLNGLNIIYQSGSHLLTLINDILDLSKVEARKMELYPEMVNLGGFLDSVVGIIYMRAREKEIEFKQEFKSLPHGVVADEKRLRQVLLNLLGNAVKFTSHGAVTLRVSQIVTQEQNVLLRFEVEDSGVGIAPHELEKIFQPFEQTGEVKKRAEGTGLGLAISRQLVELMGGAIQVRSELGQGSLFWFELTFPIAETESNEVKPKSTVTRRVVGYEGVRRRVLVADDASSNRYMLKSLLEPLGFEVAEAENGRVAFDFSLEFRPDLIITDVAMPEMTGFQLVEKIRAVPDLAAIGLIVVSASSYDMRQKAKAVADYDGYLNKPVDIDKLLDLIKQSLGLAWIYEAELDVKPEEMLQERIVPRSELEELYVHAKEGNMRKVRQKGEALLNEWGAEYHSFINEVIALARSYEEKKLRALLEEYL